VQPSAVVEDIGLDALNYLMPFLSLGNQFSKLLADQDPSQVGRYCDLVFVEVISAEIIHVKFFV